jgi:hypothetical protein
MPLIQGGQGREDCDLEAEADAILAVIVPGLAFALAFIIGFLMGRGTP